MRLFASRVFLFPGFTFRFSPFCPAFSFFLVLNQGTARWPLLAGLRAIPLSQGKGRAAATGVFFCHRRTDAEAFEAKTLPPVYQHQSAYYILVGVDQWRRAIANPESCLGSRLGNLMLKESRGPLIAAPQYSFQGWVSQSVEAGLPPVEIEIPPSFDQVKNAVDRILN